MLRTSRKEKGERPIHHPLGAKWEYATRLSPINSTAIPANTNATRMPGDGSSGKVETTIAHPASNSREPASLMVNRPRETAPSASSATAERCRGGVCSPPPGAKSQPRNVKRRLSSVQSIIFIVPRRRTSCSAPFSYRSSACGSCSFRPMFLTSSVSPVRCPITVASAPPKFCTSSRSPCNAYSLSPTIRT